MNESACVWKSRPDFVVYVTPHGEQEYLMEECPDCGRPVAYHPPGGDPKMVSEFEQGEPMVPDGCIHSIETYCPRCAEWEDVKALLAVLDA